jgi:uncharacterized protein (TIGR02271 family)
VNARRLEKARDKRARVVDTDGGKIGNLEAVYYDDTTGERTWLGIATDSGRIVAPVEGAAVEREGVRLAYTKDAVEASGVVDAESIDAEAETALRTHYELPPQVTRYEEELDVGAESAEVGAVRVRKEIETEPVEQTVERQVERAEIEHVPVEGEDSGLVETLPDGSISIPVFEEEIVVTKRLVVRERVVVRKESATEQESVTTDVRRERVEVDADAGIPVEGEI